METPKRKGLYINIWHGFESEQERQETDNWGEVGPHIGPVKYAHTTYACEIKFEFVDSAAYDAFPEAQDGHDPHSNTYSGLLKIDKNGCVIYGNKQYGDWSIYHHEAEPEKAP